MRRLALVAVSLAAAACGGGYKPSRVDADLAGLVPPDTVMLAGVRLEELKATALYKKLAAREKTPALDDLGRESGLDFRRDVKEVLLASNGADMALLARGAFQSLKPPQGKKSEYKGMTVYSQGLGAYSILDARTAVAGPETAIRRVLDQKEARSRGADGILRRVDALPVQGQLWAVLDRPADALKQLPRDGNLANVTRIFQMVDHAALAADLRNGLVARVSGECRSPEDAKLLGDAVRGFLGLARLGVPANQPQRLKLFDGIKVEQEKTAVQLAVDVPPQMVDELLGLMPATP